MKKLSSNSEVIAGYSDGFAFTAPVGSFNASKSGLYDLGGNVSEWCEDLPNRNVPKTSRSSQFRVAWCILG